jgi:subfamily B ATP-binding cassette protein HlyB/CyaB
VQLTRALGLNPGSPVTDTSILLAAKELGLKATGARAAWDRLRNVTLPAIAKLKDGEYAVILRRDADDGFLVGDPRSARPERLDRERFKAIWSGELILIKTRLRVSRTPIAPSASPGSYPPSGSTG